MGLLHVLVNFVIVGLDNNFTPMMINYGSGAC